MAKTTTGIVLKQNHGTGNWMLSRPGFVTQSFEQDTTMDAIAAQCGLDAGYWLRAAPEVQATVWTWVVL